MTAGMKAGLGLARRQMQAQLLLLALVLVAADGWVVELVPVGPRVL